MLLFFKLISLFMIVADIQSIENIVKKNEIGNIIKKLVIYLEKNFSNWEKFDKMPRPATHVPNGVIELMPVCGEKYYAFKYVNGHVPNQEKGILTIVGMGMFADVETGFPLFVSEMTLLTALRTAATSAMSSKHLARKNSNKIGIIGCGAQSEFQLIAHLQFFDIKQIKYYDIDQKAMDKMNKNMSKFGVELIPCKNAKEVAENTDIIITVTAARGKNKILESDWIAEGTHICGIGGDCPDKTELDPDLLRKSRVFVEFLKQTIYEGDIQNLKEDEIKNIVKAELWEVITGIKNGRTNDKDITIFDSVGFALEDYSVLEMFYEIILKDKDLAKNIELIPENLSNPSDLYSLIDKN